MKSMLTESQKGKIVEYMHIKTSGRITQLLDVNVSTVKEFIKKYRNTGKITNVKPTGMPQKLLESKINEVIDYLKSGPTNRTQTLKTIVRKFKLNIHPDTLSRYLKKRGLKRLNLISKPDLSTSQKEARLISLSSLLIFLSKFI